MYASSSSSSPPQTPDVNTEVLSVMNASGRYNTEASELENLSTKAQNLENQIRQHLSPQVSRASGALGAQLLKSIQVSQSTLKTISKTLELRQKEANKALKDLGKIQGKLSKLKPTKTTEINKQISKAQTISGEVTRQLERAMSPQTTIARGGVSYGIQMTAQALSDTEASIRQMGQ